MGGYSDILKESLSDQYKLTVPDGTIVSGDAKQIIQHLLNKLN